MQDIRAMWQRYREVSNEIRARTTPELATGEDQQSNTHQVLALMFEQSILLEDLLGKESQ